MTSTGLCPIMRAVVRMKVRSSIRFGLLVGLPVLVLACGCERGVASLDRQERRDPELQRARAMRMKPADALMAYRALLDGCPTLALAHLDFALLLHDQARDFVGAIYHYRRYLELRPRTEKRDLINHRMRKAELALAASIAPAQAATASTNAPQTQERDPAARMLEENAWLRVELARLTQENEDLRAAHASAPASPASPAPPVAVTAPVSPAPPESSDARTLPARQPPPAAARQHRVRRGDTLGSIAEAAYGDRKQWQRVFEANRELLKSNPNRIREGQVLVLP